MYRRVRAALIVSAGLLFSDASPFPTIGDQERGLETVPLWNFRIQASDLHALSQDPFGGSCILFPRGQSMRRTVELVCHAALTDGFHRELCLNATARALAERGHLALVTPAAVLREAPDTAWDYVTLATFRVNLSYYGVLWAGGHGGVKKPSAWDSASLCSKERRLEAAIQLSVLGGWMGGWVSGRLQARVRVCVCLYKRAIGLPC